MKPLFAGSFLALAMVWGAGALGQSLLPGMLGGCWPQACTLGAGSTGGGTPPPLTGFLEAEIGGLILQESSEKIILQNLPGFALAESGDGLVTETGQKICLQGNGSCT